MSIFLDILLKLLKFYPKLGNIVLRGRSGENYREERCRKGKVQQAERYVYSLGTQEEKAWIV